MQHEIRQFFFLFRSLHALCSFSGDVTWQSAYIASQRLAKYQFSQQRGVVCVTTGKVNCSTRCSVVGTRRTTLRGLLANCKPVSRVEARSNTSIIALRVVGGDKKGSLESETVKYGREVHGTRTREWIRCRGLAVIVNDRPILSSERMLYKDYDRRCSIEENKSGRESQGTRRQDELIGNSDSDLQTRAVQNPGAGIQGQRR
jgi:hypothetical protein